MKIYWNNKSNTSVFTCSGCEGERCAASVAFQCVDVDLVGGAGLQTCRAERGFSVSLEM